MPPSNPRLPRFPEEIKTIYPAWNPTSERSAGFQPAFHKRARCARSKAPYNLRVSRIRLAELALLYCAAIWGSTFFVVKDTLAEMVSLWADLDALEREHKLDFLREPDLGFAWAAYRWAEGAPLDEVLTETDLAAGDFVRWVKQLLDLTDQVADAAGDTPLRRTARKASDALRRGVVAYSSVSS